MIRLPRRALLAAGCALPAQSHARPASDLFVVMAGESTRLISSVMDEVYHLPSFAMPVSELRHETVPWIAGDLQEEVEAGMPGTDAVITNYAGYALGATRDLWQPVPRDVLHKHIPGLTPAGQLVQRRLGMDALVLGTIPGGPVLVHRRSVLPTAPRNAAALLDYARQNPRRFQYTRPGQSRFGQAFVTGMPYLLKDPDPLDPRQGWTGTWPYLAELGRSAAYYPSSGLAAVEEFQEGGVDLVPALIGSYLLGRATGLLPEDAICTPFDDAPLVPHSLILALPRGVPADRLGGLGALVTFMGQPEIQRILFGRGLLPGAPAHSAQSPAAQQHDHLWLSALTPELAAALAGRETAPPLDAESEAYMLRVWDERIGSRFGETR